MFKLLGEALGHSFGLAIITIINVFGVGQDWVEYFDIAYAVGYLLIPTTHLFGVMRTRAIKNKALKINLKSYEAQKEINYEMSNKITKKLDKLNIKTAKKISKIRISNAKKGVRNVTMQKVQQDTHIQ